MPPALFQRLPHFQFTGCDPFRVKPRWGPAFRGRCPRLLYESPSGIGWRSHCLLLSADCLLSSYEHPLVDPQFMQR